MRVRVGLHVHIPNHPFLSVVLLMTDESVLTPQAVSVSDPEAVSNSNSPVSREPLGSDE